MEGAPAADRPDSTDDQARNEGQSVARALDWEPPDAGRLPVRQSDGLRAGGSVPAAQMTEAVGHKKALICARALKK